MAIAIKSIPTLTEKAAKSFVKQADSSFQKKGTVNFSQEVKTAKSILAKAKLK